MAWLSGWNYRKKITIAGSTGAGTNYQVLLKVGESSGASGYDFHLEGHSASFPSDKNQGGDLRFTDDDKITLLDFWVESVTGSSPNRLAYVWVEVADDLGSNRDIYCYSKDTDILTEEGWINLKDLVESQKRVKIAVLNPKTNKVEYHYPTKFFKIYYKGKLLHQYGKSIDFLVTPNHRVWARPAWAKSGNGKPNNRSFDLIRADKLPKNVEYMKEFPYEGEKKEYFILPGYVLKWKRKPHIHKFRGGQKKHLKECFCEKKTKEKKYLMDDFLRFFGIWIAEGHIRKDGTIIITQKNKENIPIIKEWIEKLGYKPHYTKWGDIMFCDMQLAKWLQQFGHSHDKWIPKEFKNLSREQLKILFESLMLGDGSEDYYATVSKKLADDVQEIAIKVGYTATVSFRKDGIYIINLGKKRFKPKPNATKEKREWVDYDDFVYCVEVPHHIVYVRRNGKTMWNGNCYYGNPSATNASNGVNTFLFFDDFPGTSLDTNKWGSSEGGVSVADSILTLGSTTNQASQIRGNPTFSRPIAFRAKMYITSRTSSISYAGLWPADTLTGETQNGIGWGLAWEDETRNYSRVVVSSNNYAAFDVISSFGAYHIWEARWLNSSVKFYIDDTYRLVQNYSPSVALRARHMEYDANKYVKVDWTLIRKCVDPEPAFSSAGSEELPTQNTGNFFLFF